LPSNPSATPVRPIPERIRIAITPHRNPQKRDRRQNRIALEAAHWHASRQEALKLGDEDAREEDWLALLVPVDGTKEGRL
jgi:hypothetical protein